MPILPFLISFKGYWYGVTNTPFLQDGVGVLGQCYHIFNFDIPNHTILDLFDRDLGSGIQSWVNGSYMYYDGSTWNMIGGFRETMRITDYRHSFLLMGG